MAFAERAELIARLTLQDNFTSKAKAIEGRLGRLGSGFGAIGTKASQGIGTAVTNLSRLSLVAGGFLTVAIKGGIDSLATLEDATTSVDAAIKQLGLTGKVTGAQVATWANEIERSVDAAFDEKAITQAATTLIRFGRITPDNLRPALVVMTDLATKTGDVDSAASLLAKALAAPENAAGRLARQGVILTKQQQEQIDALVEAGDAAGAQAVLLDALTKATGGAAKAMHGPFRDAMLIFGDIREDAERALAEGFLPLLQRVADVLSQKLADPKVIEEIRGFGRGLANTFDKLLTIGTRLPWQQIGDSLKLAGAGAKAVFDAFAGLPPWIQTAVLTGWGLNKLTGGAVFSIGVDLFKGATGGLLQQFLGRGSPANPMFVVPVGGGLGGGPGVPGPRGGGVGGFVGTAIAGGVIVQGVMDAATIADGVAAGYRAYEQKDQQGILNAQKGIFDNVVLFPPLVRDLAHIALAEQQKVVDAILPGLRDDKDVKATDRLAVKTAALATRLQENKIATIARLDAAKSSAVSNTNRIVSAVRTSQPSVRVNVNINGIPTARVKTGTTIKRSTGFNVRPGLPE